jgi:hypothetical protein
MNLTTLLQSGFVWEFALAGAAAVFAARKTQEGIGRFRSQRLRRALQWIGLAVTDTYETYVRTLKAGRADGKLTPEERRTARRRALERAIALARQDGLDLLRELGEPRLRFWIERTVQRQKRIAR